MHALCVSSQFADGIDISFCDEAGLAVGLVWKTGVCLCRLHTQQSPVLAVDPAETLCWNLCFLSANARAGSPLHLGNDRMLQGLQTAQDVGDIFSRADEQIYTSPVDSTVQPDSNPFPSLIQVDLARSCATIQLLG